MSSWEKTVLAAAILTCWLIWLSCAAPCLMCWRNICQTVRYRKSWSDFIPDLVKLLRCCHEKSVQNKRPWGDEREIIRRIVLSLPKYFSLVSQRIAHCCETALQQRCSFASRRISGLFSRRYSPAATKKPAVPHAGSQMISFGCSATI